MTRRWSGLLFVAPFLLIYSALVLYPLAAAVATSLARADIFGMRQWAGLHNYVRLAGDAVFWSSLANSLKLVVMIVPALTVLTLLLALALNRATRGAAIFRGIFFSSSVLSVTIVTLIWRFILTPDAGLIALAATALGREPAAFLSDPALVLPAIAITTIWWSIGLPMTLFLAGLQQIPRELYEAAALDQAGPLTTLLRITLPSLRRMVVLVVVLQTAAQLQLFGQAQLLTGGGPGGASRPVVLYMYDLAFGRWELGYATAAAQALFLLILAVTVTQFLLAGREDPQP